MASRMEKFHNMRSLIGKRSQRNQLLYKQIETLLEINNEKTTSSYNDENEKSINKLENLFDNYETYKHAEKEQPRLKRYYSDDIDIYNELNEFDYDLSRLSRISRLKERDNYDDKNDLLSTFNNTSHYKENLNLNNIAEENIKEPVDNKINNDSKGDIQSLFNNKENFKDEKLIDKSSIHDKDIEDEKKRKLNLKIKFITGIIFIINTIIIMVLVFKSIK